MNLVVMGTDNPMVVEYYTYKVEFQERGAGHIYGTLRLKLDMMERLVRTDDDNLILCDEDIKELDMKVEGKEDGDEIELDKPFKGLSSALKNQRLWTSYPNWKRKH